MNTTTERQHYGGLITTRTTVECSPLLDASNVKLKARKSNTEWQEVQHDLTLGSDPSAGSSSSRLTHEWETGF